MKLTLESPFYRVTAKAIVFDDQKRMLLVENDKRKWETPGGGWEHDESFEECLDREFREELSVGVVKVGPILFQYRGLNNKGYMQLRLVAQAALQSVDFKPGDDIINAKFVTKEEFLKTDFSQDEGPIQQFADLIWSLEPSI